MRLLALISVGIGLWLGGVSLPNVASAQDWYEHYQSAVWGRKFRYSDYDGRLAEIDKAIRLAPKEYSGFVLIGRGIILRKAGRFDQAIADFKKALSAKYLQEAWQLEGHTELAQAFFDKRDLKSAKREFETLKALATKREDRGKAWFAEQHLMEIASAQQQAKAALAKPKPKANVEVAKANELPAGELDSGGSSVGTFLDRLSAKERAQYEKDRAEQERAQQGLGGVTSWDTLADLRKNFRISKMLDHARSLEARGDFEAAVEYLGLVELSVESDDRGRVQAIVNELRKAQGVARGTEESPSEEAQVEQAIAKKEAEVEAKVVEKAAPGGLVVDERAQIEKDRAELAGLRERLAALEQHKAQPAQPEPAPVAAPKPAFDPGKRIALVIGNSAYNHVPLLKNPASDAKAVADSFRKLGFAEVIEKHDLSFVQLSAELQAFGDRAFDADWAVIYFAGHGVEVDRRNYLIPVDAELKAAAHVDFQAVPLERATGAVGGARQLRLVILDACRDNPFAKQMAMRGGTRSVGRGLARVEPQDGVLVAYAAEDGQVALDGDGANSPFASALVQHLQEPGLEVGLLFRRIATTVRKRTGDRQVPFTYGSLTDAEFYFNAAK